ncbi:thioredoxin family protein [Bradymonas sediminis]|uniref:Uncharacterized protein n=1 Tax=Bradymonas sediminis TaxID=1548548 RepID=A0A2Z4FK59_9DELT|nr:thioredoxin family protein [Bradymonas sediminis]AWV89351.1 hypothetical protein DN745_08380 [Bradymonas sediminis]TDP73530.1 thioredoxin [Bradymonas sediminis]
MIELSSLAQLDALKSEHEVLLVYFTPPSCSVGVSLFDRVSAQVQARAVSAARVDTTAYPAIAGQHLVLAFPTILVFVYGREFERLSRVFSMSDVERALERALEIVEQD